MEALGIIFQAPCGNSSALCCIVLFERNIFGSHTQKGPSVCLSVRRSVMLEEKAARRAPLFGRTLFIDDDYVKIAADLFS